MRTKEYENQCIFFLNVLSFGGNKNSILFSSLLGKRLIEKIIKKKSFHLISSLFACINYRKITFPQGMAEDIETSESNVFFCCVNRKPMYC